LDHTKKKSHLKKRSQEPQKSKKRSKKVVICPFEAPEIVEKGFLCTDFSDQMTKADVFSLGMLLVKLICYSTGEDFSRYSVLNQLKN
jgi:hypothetical protein